MMPNKWKDLFAGVDDVEPVEDPIEEECDKCCDHENLTEVYPRAYKDKNISLKDRIDDYCSWADSTQIRDMIAEFPELKTYKFHDSRAGKLIPLSKALNYFYDGLMIDNIISVIPEDTDGSEFNRFLRQFGEWSADDFAKYYQELYGHDLEESCINNNSRESLNLTECGFHFEDCDDCEESLEEDTEKKSNGKWVNKGDEGTHGEFDTKKEADAQRKAMFANGYHEELEDTLSECDIIEEICPECGKTPCESKKDACPECGEEPCVCAESCQEPMKESFMWTCGLFEKLLQPLVDKVIAALQDNDPEADYKFVKTSISNDNELTLCISDGNQEVCITRPIDCSKINTVDDLTNVYAEEFINEFINSVDGTLIDEACLTEEADLFDVFEVPDHI